MKTRKSLVLTAIAASVTLAACNTSSNDPAEVPGNVLLNSNRIAYLDFASPGNSLTVLGEVTGLTAGDTLVSIDRRPQNGFLYGIGYNASAAGGPTITLYAIHPETRVATAVGEGGRFTTDGVNPSAIGGSNPSTRFEMDFNPAVDRLRVINDLGQNFRMNPNTGAVVDGDLGGTAGSVNGINMDRDLNGGANRAQGTAYINNTPNPNTPGNGITTQYTVGEAPSALYIQNPPNMGTLSAPITLSPLIRSVLGFDIAPGANMATTTANAPTGSGSGYLLLRTDTSSPEALARLNLVTGELTRITEIAGGAGARGIAVQAPLSRAMLALSANGTQLLRFAEDAPGTVVTVAVSGLSSGESLVGMDFRPATGQLFALGINPVTDTGTVYRLDPETGAAAVIGTAGSIAFVTGSLTPVDLPDPASAGYGVDFNPAADRLRVTTSTGLNFRLDQRSGTPLDGDAVAPGTNPDGTINGNGVTGVSGAAYTNSVGGTTLTTLYALSDTGSTLTIQNSLPGATVTGPNSGSQTQPLTLRLDGSTLTFTASNGFDIPSDVRAPANNAAVTQGSGYAALTVGGTTGLYRIELSSGVVKRLGTIGSGAALRGLTIGQTHAR